VDCFAYVFHHVIESGYQFVFVVNFHESINSA
jgi:hypothetical protein